ncbi:MAG: acyltransferase family protein [Mariniblastus sp.]
MAERVKQIRALTGLRFLAAFAVFIHHINGHFGLPSLNFPLGSAGVSFFFVLSGFILTYVYFNRLKTRGEIVRFYFTRWARIWPLHIVTLIVFMLLIPNILIDEPVKLICNALLLQSWIPNFTWAFSGNGVSWSISTEAFFYLMFPVLFAGTERDFWWKYAAVIASTISIILLLQFCHERLPSSDWPQYSVMPRVNPLLRLAEFATGMAIGHLFMNSSAPTKRNFWMDTIYELASIGLMIGFYIGIRTLFIVFPFPEVLRLALLMSSPCFCFALIIYCFAHSVGAFSRVFSTRLLVYLGEISFSFYMIHNIVILALRKVRWVPAEPDGVVFFVGSFVISVCAAGMLYAIVEIPAKNCLVRVFDWFSPKKHDRVRKTINATAIARLVIHLVAIGIPFFIAIQYFRSQNLESFPDPVIRQVMQDTEIFKDEVHFGDEAILHGVVCVPEYKGKLIRMVWEKKKSKTTKRFIHVCDKNQTIVYHVRHQDHEAFDKREKGLVWYDEFYLAPEMLENAAFIGIGFSDGDKGGVKVSAGPTSLDQNRLNVFDFRQSN